VRRPRTLLVAGRFHLGAFFLGFRLVVEWRVEDRLPHWVRQRSQNLARCREIAVFGLLGFQLLFDLALVASNLAGLVARWISCKLPDRHVRVDLRGLEIGVAQHGLDGADIGAPF